MLGNITSRNSFGTNYLIKGAGAKLVQTWQDVVAEFPADVAARILPPGLERENATAAAAMPADVPEEERALLKLLSGDEAVHTDALAEASVWTVHELASVLLGLEMRELVKQRYRAGASCGGCRLLSAEAASVDRDRDGRGGSGKAICPRANSAGGGRSSGGRRPGPTRRR